MDPNAALPPPPTADELTLKWFMDPASKVYLSALMARAYAVGNLQIIVIKNGIRQPPVTVQIAGLTAHVEITV